MVECSALHPPERPGVQRFAWEMEEESRLERDISKRLREIYESVIEMESVYGHYSLNQPSQHR